jgi:hypothetical protein
MESDHCDDALNRWDWKEWLWHLWWRNCQIRLSALRRRKVNTSWDVPLNWSDKFFFFPLSSGQSGDSTELKFGNQLLENVSQIPNGSKSLSVESVSRASTNCQDHCSHIFSFGKIPFTEEWVSKSQVRLHKYLAQGSDGWSAMPRTCDSCGLA